MSGFRSAAVGGSSNFNPASLVVFGDSITDAGSDYSTGASKYLRFNDYGWWCWAQRLLGYPWDFIRNSGISGETTLRMLARLNDEVLRYNPGWVWFLGGTNDIYRDESAIDTFNRIKEIAERCINNGAIFVLQTVWARSDSSATAARRLQHGLLNDYIRAYAIRTPGVILVDAYAVTVNPASTTMAEITNYLYDNLHPSNLAGYAVGKEVARVLQRYAPPADPLISSIYDTYTNNPSGLNIFGDSGLFQTPESSAAAGMSGQEAANWNITRGAGTPTSVNSVVAHPLGIGNIQRMTVTAGANNDAVYLANGEGVSVAGRTTPGMWVRAECEVWVRNAVNFKGVELLLGITDANSALSMNLRDNAYQSGSAVAYLEDFYAVLKTPWFQFTTFAAPSNVHPQVRTFFAGVGGAIIDVGRMAIKKALNYQPLYVKDAEA